MQQPNRSGANGVNRAPEQGMRQREWGASEDRYAVSENAPVQPAERLPFTVTVVEDELALDKALKIRRSAYGRHMPELAETLSEAEQHDYDPGSIILLAESKLDGEPLGTMRVQTNEYKPLWLEESVVLPEQLRRLRLAEGTRLGVVPSRAGTLVKFALCKAMYQYCINLGVNWMVIAARSPLDRQYQTMLFSDLFPEKGFIPMKHAANVPHRVFGIDLAEAASIWQSAEHPLYGFMIDTYHPDIAIDTAPFMRDESSSGIYDDMRRWRMER